MSQWQIYGQREREKKGVRGKQKQTFIISNSVSINSIVLETGPKFAPTGREGNGACPPLFAVVHMEHPSIFMTPQRMSPRQKNIKTYAMHATCT